MGNTKQNGTHLPTKPKTKDMNKSLIFIMATEVNTHFSLGSVLAVINETKDRNFTSTVSSQLR